MDIGSILQLNKDTFFYPPQAVFNSTILPRLPHDIVADGEINPEAVIVGANQDEGLLDTLSFILDPDLYEKTRDQWGIRGPMAEFGKRFQGNMTDITKQDVDQSLELLLHNVNSLENVDSDHFLNLTRMQTDVYFYGTQILAEMLSEKGVTAYQYLFTYKGDPLDALDSDLLKNKFEVKMECWIITGLTQPNTVCATQMNFTCFGAPMVEKITI